MPITIEYPMLLVDINMQYDIILAKVKYCNGKDEIIQDSVVKLPSEMDWKNDFMQNIYGRREHNIEPLYYRGDHYAGWVLSNKEHERILNMQQLFPAVQEFKRLAAYN